MKVLVIVFIVVASLLGLFNIGYVIADVVIEKRHAAAGGSSESDTSGEGD